MDEMKRQTYRKPVATKSSPMSNTEEEFSRKNHGLVMSDGTRGTKIMDAYGKDDSNVTGKPNDERVNNRARGGVDNLAHSFSGGKAKQE